MKKLNPTVRLLVLAIAFVFSTLVSSSSEPVAASGPIKQKSGIHLGNRPDADWTPELLAQIDGDNGGIWPKAVVFLSSQLYNLSRDGNCRIRTGANDTTTGRPVLLDYLQRASLNGVRVLIRIHPSPGNFDSAHRLQADAIPGIGYCDWNNYRPADDIADEIVAIRNYNQANGITEWGFEPANEPNAEWYKFGQPVEPNDLTAWHDMNEYFKAIYTDVDLRNSSIRVLTPPMAQAAYAEMNNVNDIDRPDPCPPMRLEDNQSTGYGVMQDYYTNYNDGIDWHNYWRLGFEWSGACSVGAQHVSYFFPDWMQNLLKPLGEKDGTVTEADLFSPIQDSNSPLQDKDDRGGWPAANSLRKFITHEFRSDTVVAWLLSDWSSNPSNHCPNPEHHWHEAYRCTDQTERDWFTQWWPNFEHWTPPVYLADVRSGDASWDSEILIQNATDWPFADVTIDLFDDGGNHAGQYTCSGLKRKTTCVVNPTNTGFNGWAVVSAERNVAAVTLTRNGYELTAYNGLLSDDADLYDVGDPGWERAGTELYAPMVKRDWYNRWSEIYVMNAGTRATNVHVVYYGENEFTHDGGTLQVGPGERVTFSPEGHSWQNLHSAYITSSNPLQPLAAVVMEYTGPPWGTKLNRTTHNVFRQGQRDLFAPLVKKDWSGQRTGLTIQNVGDQDFGDPTDVYVDYYDTNGNHITTIGPTSPITMTNPPGCLDELEAKYWCVVYNPDALGGTFLGSAKIHSDRENVVGMVHEAGNNRFMSHLMALANDSQVIYSPIQGRWTENPGTPDEKDWAAAMMIMNVGDQATDVTVQLYNENGDPIGTPITKDNLPAHGGFTTWPDIEGLEGSAVATSSGEPIVAEVNYVNNEPTGDTGSSFNGANR